MTEISVCLKERFCAAKLLISREKYCPVCQGRNLVFQGGGKPHPYPIRFRPSHRIRVGAGLAPALVHTRLALPCNTRTHCSLARIRRELVILKSGSLLFQR